MTADPASRRSGGRSGSPPRVGAGARLTVLLGATIAALVAGCDATSSEPEATPDSYRAELAAICTETTAALDALPTPPEQISVTEFAVDAASLLVSEAEQARRLDVPDELADDHRAFVRNTDDQAAGWRAIADSEAGTSGTSGTLDTDGSGDDSAGDGSTVAESDLVALTTRIAELQLGRDDLVTEMGVAACRRGDG